MIARTVVGALVAVVMAGFLSASTVHAKACPALCSAQIKACKATCLTAPKAKCKRACKKHFVDECKQTAPKAKDRTCPSSPSGAFID